MGPWSKRAMVGVRGRDARTSIPFFRRHDGTHGWCPGRVRMESWDAFERGGARKFSDSFDEAPSGVGRGAVVP